MNQKEYDLIATTIRDRLDGNNAAYMSFQRQEDKLACAARYFEDKKIVEDLALALAENYPKTFDRTKFLTACGLANEVQTK